MRSSWLLVLLALLQPLGAQAQAIRGRVVDRISGGPIAGALIELQDGSGRVLQRGLSTPTGSFSFVPPGAGDFRIRAAAIGYSIRPPERATIHDADLALGDLWLEPAARILPDIVAAGKRRACGRELLDDPILGRLLEGARTSLTLIEATLALAPRFAVEEVRTTSVLTRRGPVVRADTALRILAEWPITGADPEVLRRDGFARLLAPKEGEGRIWYGPDLAVLFSDWFLESHCYSLQGNKKDEAAGVIRVRYEPGEKSKLVDLSGELVIDAVTLALREFTFTHRNLPSHIKGGLAGGMIAFARLGAGAWLPVRWQIFAPIESAPPAGKASRTVVLSVKGASPRFTQPRSVTGRVELTGRVINVPDDR